MANSFLKTLQQVNWKRHGNTLIKVFSDFKNLALLALMGFILYGVGWDTILRPSLQQIKDKDAAIQTQKDALGQKGDLQKKYDVWDQQLKGLTQDLIVIPAGNSAKVLSVSESSNLLALAHGENREATGLAPLQSPHDKRDSIGLTATVNNTVDVLPLLDPNAAAAPATPAPSLDMTRTGAESQPSATTLPVERYDYDLKASGTYPALIDLINLLVMQKKIVKINKVVIGLPEKQDEEQPDAKSFPDYPVKLEMVISLSLFLYAEQPNAGQ